MPLKQLAIWDVTADMWERHRQQITELLEEDFKRVPLAKHKTIDQEIAAWQKRSDRIDTIVREYILKKQKGL